MTTVRTRKTIRATRKAFEEGKAVFCDENGELMAAGKVFPTDEPSAKEFLVWPLADITNGTHRPDVADTPPCAQVARQAARRALYGSSVRALLRDDGNERGDDGSDDPNKDPRPPPFASGGEWDEPRPELDEPHPELDEPHPELDEPSREQPPPEDDDVPSADDDEPLASPEPEVQPPQPRKVRRLRPMKVPKKPPPAQKRRFLVINQPLSKIAATPPRPHRRADKPKSPDPLATVTRHFSSPILRNHRYPPVVSKHNFTSEYSNKFAWPEAAIRLR